MAEGVEDPAHSNKYRRVSETRRVSIASMTTMAQEAEQQVRPTLSSQLVASMEMELDETLRRLIGQMLLVSFDGPVVTPAVRTLIEKYYVGNFSISRKNIRDAVQLSSLTKELQKIAQAAGYQQPLLIGIDQENGMLSRFGDGVRGTHFPGSMVIGASRHTSNAYDIAKAMAKELVAVGINWVFAPILDVVNPSNAAVIGVRSFGEEAQNVGRFGQAFADGLRAGGLACSAGHFPATGGAARQTAMLQNGSVEDMESEEYVPFRRAMTAGFDSVRVSSSIWPQTAQDVAQPKHVIQEVLRRKIGYEGVIISDCTEMPSFTLRADISEAVELAIQAGCDVLQIDQSVTTQSVGIEAIYRAVQTGRIIRGDIHRAAARLAKLKENLLNWGKVLSTNDPTLLPSLMAEHAGLVKKVYDSSTTLVRDTEKYIPLSLRLKAGDVVLLLTPVVRPLHPKQDGELAQDPFECLGKAISTRHPKVWHMPYNVHGISQVHLALMKKASAFIMVTCNALQSKNDYQIHAARSVARIACGRPIINIAVCNPYDLLADTSFPTYICTYEYTQPALEAAASIVFGEHYPTGDLPVATSSIQQKKWSVEVWDKRRDLFSSADLWKECLGSRWPLDAATLSSLLHRPGYSKHFVVRSPTGELLGLAVTYNIMGQNRVLGSLAVLIVRPTHRNLGIGLSLHDCAIRHLSKIPNLSSMQLGSIFPRFFPGLPVDLPQTDLEWFSHRGWKLEDKFIYDLYTKIDQIVPPVDVYQSLTSRGVIFNSCRPEQFPELMEFETRHFSNYPGWVEKYLDLQRTEDIQDVILATVENRIVGAALVFSAVGNNQISKDIPWPAAIGERNGGLACVSVGNEFRGLGLGLGLIYAALTELRARGLTGCFVDWVDWNEFDGTYRQLGFQEWGRYREIWRKL